ncbi:hypothetical protein LL295_02825 [Vibrio campbellii]|uniref:hypothetical protein n=1 Tax=Vibrio campbellii TaxID=680 RepID=UPI000D49777E|nr:hypothetical protein [Vibrio campbellii]MCC4222443.1 hypothetical protein [Vibrio campbellii]PQJ44483.1 hypothetical protein BTN99_14740 [Vibrio campbellii]
MLRFYFCSLLSLCLLTQTAYAQGAWWQAILSDASVVEVQQTLQEGGEWYTCEAQESAGAFCLDDFHYYQQHLYGEATTEAKAIRLIFLTDYQPQNLSELILNLRKDGLVMKRIAIQGEQYDVAEALKHNSPEVVDKALVLFINRYPQQVPRRIDWVLAQEFGSPVPRLNVTLNSDGEMIELEVIRF